MERDKRFEIQYLLSIIVAVIGAITAKQIRPFIDLPVAYVLLIIIFIHLVMFNISYTLGSATDFAIPIADRFESRLQWTLIATTAAFLFFVLHLLGLTLFTIFSHYAPNTEILVWPIFSLSCCSVAKIVISYALPALVVAAIACMVGQEMIPSVDTFRNVDFSIRPDHLRVYPDYNDPLLVRVVNDTNTEQPFEINFDLPEYVVAQYRHREYYDDDDWTESVEIEPDDQSKLQIQLKYTGQERRRDVVDITLEHPQGKQQKSLDVMLVE